MWAQKATEEQLLWNSQKSLTTKSQFSSMNFFSARLQKEGRYIGAKESLWFRPIITRRIAHSSMEMTSLVMEGGLDSWVNNLFWISGIKQALSLIYSSSQSSRAEVSCLQYILLTLISTGRWSNLLMETLYSRRLKRHRSVITIRISGKMAPLKWKDLSW